jgi:hypothetical protein
MKGPRFSLIMRASGERTVELSQALALRQVGGCADLVVIEKSPFEEALRASYEAGIRVGATWTITLDADVLLYDRAIDRLLTAASSMPDHFFELEGHIYDKVTGRFRQAGHRVYRTELLPKALPLIPPVGRVIQPEFHTVSAMRDDGHPFRHIGEVVGLHDFEQYFSDLYRKSRVHARKMGAHLPLLIQRCSALGRADPDFRIILKGLWDELTTDGKIAVVDSRHFSEEAAAAVRSLGLNEKTPVHSGNAQIDAIMARGEAMVASQPPPAQRWHDYEKELGPGESVWGKLVANVVKRGLLKGVAATAGAGLKTAGHWLDR